MGKVMQWFGSVWSMSESVQRRFYEFRFLARLEKAA